MKVLQINTVCGILSTGKICSDLAEILEQNNHDCKIAYGRMEVPQKYEKYAIRVGGYLTNKFDAVFSKIFDNVGFNSVIPTMQLVKKIKEFAPDIIHLHNLHGSYINLKILFDFLKKYNKPVVWTLHDCWAYTGHCAHFAEIGCEKWKTECFKCPKKSSYPKSMFFDFSKRNYKLKKKLFTSLEKLTIITPSKWLCELVEQSFLGKYDIKVINNGIDLEMFKPTVSKFREEYGLENKKIVLGVASAWGKAKGFYDFIKLSSLLDETYQIILVGVTEEQKKLLPNDIIAISKTNNAEELAQIYTVADVFVNATYSDTFPTVNIEAQACGTPVITYKTGGSPENVFEKNVVPVGDINALCEKIKYVTSVLDENINTKALENSRIYEKSAQYEKYLKVYQNVLNIK